jgi:hypothetical protein
MVNHIFYCYIGSTLEKILRQNTKIISKLDVIISNQKSLEARVLKIEEACNNNINNDAEFIKVRLNIKI